ncbi:MAG: DUF2934 domain-containing protein [Sulfuritalea sp.]|nr:DUF2934 domain-containing protein [Sulfuritalea sp.]
MVSSKKNVPVSAGKRAAPTKPSISDTPVKPPTAKPKTAKKPGTTGKTSPAVKMAAARPSVEKPARSPRKKKPAVVPVDQRKHYVEVAAYHIAERRGFAPGNPLDDWVQAEAEIDRLLAAGLLGG